MSEMKIRDCPFLYESWVVGDARAVYHFKCAIMGENNCLFEDMTYEDVQTCKIIKRLLRAFQGEEYRVIQHMWHKMRNFKKWETFVILHTDRLWRLWQTNLGKFLMEKCRANVSCPFKALLPENE